jgi:eukaryotic-like serine/threonine-protein kinase
VRLGSRAHTFSSTSRGTENLRAWSYFARGRYHLNARGADNLRLAISYFDSAIAQDPQFARAYAGSATAYALLPEYTDRGPQNASQMTHAAADKALSLDPSLAEAYTAIGLTEVHDWNVAKADSAYRKALAIDSLYPTAHQWYGELLFHIGRLDSSTAQIRKAVALDPLAPINASALGYALVVSGRVDEAISELKKGIEIAPTLGLHHFMLGDAYLVKGRVREAVGELEIARRLDPELALRKGYLAYAYGLLGDTAKANTIIADLEQRQRSNGKSGVALATAYLGQRQYDKAVAALQDAVNEHDISLVTSSSLIPDRMWDPLRNDPRFDAVLARMNLLPYEREYRKRVSRR